MLRKINKPRHVYSQSFRISFARVCMSNDQSSLAVMQKKKRCCVITAISKNVVDFAKCIWQRHKSVANQHNAVQSVPFLLFKSVLQYDDFTLSKPNLCAFSSFSLFLIFIPLILYKCIHAYPVEHGWSCSLFAGFEWSYTIKLNPGNAPGRTAAATIGGKITGRALRFGLNIRFAPRDNSVCAA